MKGLSPRASLIALVAGAASSTVLLAGCGPMLTASAGTGDTSSSASIKVTPAAGATNASVLEPVVVHADDGRLTAVNVKGGMGSVPGTLSPDSRTWTSAEGVDLPFGTTYQVEAVAVDGEGRVQQVTETFSTVKPAEEVKPAVLYMNNYDTYGVGMPIIVNFNVPVTEKKAVEEKLSLTSSKPLEGAWSWNEANTRVTFRPKEFWPSGTAVSFRGDLYGVKLSETAYGADDLEMEFTTGPKVVMNVDVNTLQMTVSRDDVPLKTVPVTIGKDGYKTHDGVKVITGKEGTITMRSDPGDPEYYVAPNVQYSMRLTEHGEYFHAAPWAADAFGQYRYSHGCISMTTENAGWLWDNVNEGDIVTTFGTGEPWLQDNGVTAWNYTWDQWLARSETKALAVGPQGATPVGAAPAAAAPAS